MVQKTKRIRTGTSANTRGGRNQSDRMRAAGRKYAAGGYKDKQKMTNLSRTTGGKYQSRKARVEIQKKKGKIQNQIKTLESILERVEKQLELWEKKRKELYEECSKRGIYNAVTYGIIGDFEELNKLDNSAKRQMALRYTARLNEINKKRGALINRRQPIIGEIYQLKQELKKLK